MDEENAAAPVGGDRGGGAGSRRLRVPPPSEPEAGGGGPGRRLRGQRRGLRPGAWASCLGTLLGPVPGLGRLGVVALTSPALLPQGLV